MKAQKFYIKKRDNLQAKPYCVCYGKLSATAAKRMEKTLSGYNYVYGYDTEQEYHKAILDFEKEGFSIQDKPALK